MLQLNLHQTYSSQACHLRADHKVVALNQLRLTYLGIDSCTAIIEARRLRVPGLQDCRIADSVGSAGSGVNKLTLSQVPAAEPAGSVHKGRGCVSQRSVMLHVVWLFLYCVYCHDVCKVKFFSKSKQY